MKGHYNTFLEECVRPEKKYGDQGQPTAANQNLGKCNYWPNFSSNRTPRKLDIMECFIPDKKLLAQMVLRLNATCVG